MGRFSNFVSSPEPQPEPQIVESVVQPEPEIAQTPVVEEKVESAPQIDVYEEIQKQSSIVEEDLPATPEEAIEKNLLFSKKTYLKQFELEPEPPKELNPGQTLFRHKLLKQPKKTKKFTSSPSIRATKDPEQPFVPVEYAKPKTLRSSKVDVPVEEVVQDVIQDVKKEV